MTKQPMRIFLRSLRRIKRPSFFVVRRLAIILQIVFKFVKQRLKRLQQITATDTPFVLLLSNLGWSPIWHQRCGNVLATGIRRLIRSLYPLRMRNWKNNSSLSLTCGKLKVVFPGRISINIGPSIITSILIRMKKSQTHVLQIEVDTIVRDLVMVDSGSKLD